MKILVTSDWHLDYWSESVTPPELVPHLRGIDGLILAGDLADDPLRTWPVYLNWLGRQIDPAKVHILPGNHDYYGHRVTLPVVTGKIARRLKWKRLLPFPIEPLMHHPPE